MSNQKILAAFVLAPCEGGVERYAAIIRPDREGIGLPGGKLEEGEDPRQAAIRESTEEGWRITGIDNDPFIVQTINGKRIAWFRASKAVPLTHFKEEGRIDPIKATKQEVIASGWGNENLFFMVDIQEEKLRRLADQVDQLTDENDGLTNNLALAEGEVERWRDEVKFLRQKSKFLEEELESIKKERDLLRSDRTSFMKKVGAMQVEIEKLNGVDHE